MVTKQVDAKEEDQVMEAVDMTKLPASPKPGRQVAETMTNVLEAMQLAYSIHNIGFRELMNDREHTQEEFLLDSVDLVYRIQ